MVKETKHKPDPRELTAVMGELSSVLSLIRNKTGSEAPQKTGLVVARVIAGVTLPEWEDFAVNHGLESWLAMPLEGSLAEAITAVMSMQENLARQRDIDALTGIGNRGFFDRRLKNEIERAKRLDTQLAMVLIDIDDFKKVNDTYGHQTGDSVLQGLGEALKSSLRRNDVVSRYGGEEFAVLLTNENLDQAVKIADKARNAIEIMDVHDAPRVTVSIGCTAYLPGEASESFFKRADEALYAAKRSGKNRVCTL